jgi:hypothetical protein
VGGDPAELMRICVENGTFTIAFLREGVTKVRSLEFFSATCVFSGAVPRVDRRSLENVLGSMPRYRRLGGKS